MLGCNGIDEKRPSVLQIGDHHHADDGQDEYRPSRPVNCGRPRINLCCYCHVFSPRRYFRFVSLDRNIPPKTDLCIRNNAFHLRLRFSAGSAAQCRKQGGGIDTHQSCFGNRARRITAWQLSERAFIASSTKPVHLSGVTQRDVASFSLRCNDLWRERAIVEKAKGPPENQRPLNIENPSWLFSRDLPWRVERAGIMDFGHLMVGEAENLAEDLVGMFAEQGRAQHLGGTVGQS